MCHSCERCPVTVASLTDMGSSCRLIKAWCRGDGLLPDPAAPRWLAAGRESPSLISSATANAAKSDTALVSGRGGE